MQVNYSSLISLMAYLCCVGIMENHEGPGLDPFNRLFFHVKLSQSRLPVSCGKGCIVNGSGGALGEGTW